jgi:hypothetical protein
VIDFSPAEESMIDDLAVYGLETGCGPCPSLAAALLPFLW